jgi:hypothetical protein
MHFTWDVSLGQLGTIVAILGVGVRFHRDWVVMQERVAELWLDYEARMGIRERRKSSRATSSGD